MKERCIYAMGLFFGVVCALWSAPDIHSENPAFDFGAVDNTTIVKHTYKVTNAGDEPLVIGQIKPSCGCTVANISSKNLAPGATATLEVELNLKGRSGNQYKTFSIYSNDPDEKIYQLRMTGKAVPEIEVVPASVSLGVIPVGSADFSKLSRNIVLKTTKDTPFKILSVTPLRKMVTTKVTTIEEGKQYQIRIDVVEQDFQGGMLRDTLSIRTDNPKSPILSVPVYATVRDLLTVIPNPLKLSSAVAVPVTRYITIRGGSVANFEVISASCFECDPGTSLVVQNKGRYGYRIQISNLDASKVVPGQKVVVKTNVQGRESIEIPIELVKPVTTPGAASKVVRPAPTPQRIVRPVTPTPNASAVKRTPPAPAVAGQPVVVKSSSQSVVSKPVAVPASGQKAVASEKSSAQPPSPKRLPPPDKPLIFRPAPVSSK